MHVKIKCIAIFIQKIEKMGNASEIRDQNIKIRCHYDSFWPEAAKTEGIASDGIAFCFKQ